MENYSLYIYLGILSLVIIVFVLWLLRKINITEKLRKKSIHEIKDFHAVETEMPIDNPDLKKILSIIPFTIIFIGFPYTSM